MTFDFFTCKNHETFFARYGADTDNPQKVAFIYIVGASDVLRARFGDFYDNAMDAFMPDRVGTIPDADAALLDIADEIRIPGNTCLFMWAFRRLTKNGQRVVVEALGQLIGLQN